jgi:cell wall-associated NlpC family hydrolase
VDKLNSFWTGPLITLVLFVGIIISTGIQVQPWSPWYFAARNVQSIQVAQPTEQTRSTPAALSTPVPSITSDVGALIAAAKSWLGVHYLWGGCSRTNGIDCSCFVQTAFQAIGVHLPRVTTEQIRVGTPVTSGQAAAGDLVFFDNTCTNCGDNPTHVGLVLGGGQMIDAGDPVKIEPIYGGHNARFRRVLP